MELGLISLADLTPDPATGDVAPAGRRITDIVRAAVLADEAGLDVFAVGEHHHPNYAVSSPAVVLAAIAQATTRIKLTSATTLIGVLDPVRVYEDFATVDLISGRRGRA
ncbi:LLM class flavin-dependent oxidoreductase, partial [Streptomyces olivaceoviridis]